MGKRDNTYLPEETRKHYLDFAIAEFLRDSKRASRVIDIGPYRKIINYTLGVSGVHRRV